MAHILLTAGPTRAYIDDVRYITNASSGRMAKALAAAALARGHRVTIVSGPVAIDYPATARVIPVVTTSEMLAASLSVLPACDGVIAAAAPCDFEPAKKAAGKIPRQGSGLTVALEPTTDVIATLAARSKRGPARESKWFVAFALEPGADRKRACEKVTAKQCDLIVVNDLSALEADATAVDVYDADHQHVGAKKGTKKSVATWLIRLIEATLVAAAKP
jgi:phosphopantothenoylcysteine decarboxylase/phosphopantothenate--cysteine ligase